MFQCSFEVLWLFSASVHCLPFTQTLGRYCLSFHVYVYSFWILLSHWIWWVSFLAQPAMTLPFWIIVSIFDCLSESHNLSLSWWSGSPRLTLIASAANFCMLFKYLFMEKLDWSLSLTISNDYCVFWYTVRVYPMLITWCLHAVGVISQMIDCPYSLFPGWCVRRCAYSILYAQLFQMDFCWV